METSVKIKMADIFCIKTSIVNCLESFLWRGYTPTYRKVKSSNREIINLISRELLYMDQNGEIVQSPFVDESIMFGHVLTVCVWKCFYILIVDVTATGDSG